MQTESFKRENVWMSPGRDTIPFTKIKMLPRMNVSNRIPFQLEPIQVMENLKKHYPSLFTIKEPKEIEKTEKVFTTQKV